MLRWLLAVVGGVVIAIQVVRPALTNPPGDAAIEAPAAVVTLLHRACWDCHSNQTVWPWYAQVAPLSWLVAHDVQEGRGELDFSHWADYGPGRQAKKLREIAKVVGEGEMPPWYYVALHPEAGLDAGERAQLIGWASSPPAHP